MKRLTLIDIFRIISAFMIFLFHSKIHIGINYGIFNNFIGTGHIFMVAFFMISGFSLFYVNKCKNNLPLENNTIISFFKKRFVSLYPLYIIVYVLFLCLQVLKIYIFKINVNDYIGIKGNIILAPVELFVLQSAFIGSFSLLHNGGTWFISCIFICYIFYPYLAYVINKNNKKQNIVLGIIIYILSSYAFIPVYKFHLASIYSNPLFRMLEFSLGIIICKFYLDSDGTFVRKHYKKILGGVTLFLIIIISFGVLIIPFVEAYNFIAIPCFVLVIYVCAQIEKTCQFNKFNTITKIMSENTYAFWLAQFFSYEPIKILINHRIDFFQKYENIKKGVLALFINLIFALILHYAIEKPLQNLLKKNKYIWRKK